MVNMKEYFKIYESAETKEVLEENEVDANRLSFIVIAACAVILLISWALDMANIFDVAKSRMTVLAIVGLTEFGVASALYWIFKGEKPWLKYVMVITLLAVCMQLFGILNHNVILIMILPVLLSSRYFSKGFTTIVAILTALLFVAASVMTVFYGIIDLNFYPKLGEGTVITVHNGLRHSVTELGVDSTRAVSSMLENGYLPRILVFVVISIIAVYIAKQGHEMVLKQHAISSVSASAKAELNTATQIQNGMVPNIFPAFPEREEFEVYASMDTAKEVGGDFYDFFLIDDTHLAIIMADVSGKGVPAALFMMASKILIGDRTLMGGTPAEILQFVNDRICSNNEAEMFVTVWLGILNIETGILTASNAGHEYPVIRRKDGNYQLFKERHGLAVGCMEGIAYKNYEVKLNKGDAIFLYTDGVPEASDADMEQFGVERMLQALNIHPDDAPEEILATVKKEVDGFVGDAVQFDDITMLCLKFFGKGK